MQYRCFTQIGLTTKVLTFIVLLLSSISLEAQINEWSDKVPKILETKDLDTLKLIYDAWAEESRKLISDTKQNQKDFIRVAYDLYPEIVDHIYAKFCHCNYYISSDKQNNYFLLNSSLTVIFSEEYFDSFQLLAKELNISTDSAQNLISGNDLFKDLSTLLVLRSMKQKISSLTINNFYPNLRNDSLKVIFSEDGNLFMNYYNHGISDESIEFDLKSQGNDIREIRKINGGAFSSSSMLSIEKNERINFFTQLRINIKDRIRSIYFQPDLKKAIVAIRSGLNEDCCSIVYVLFEYKDNKWSAKEHLNQREFLCSDGPHCCIR